MLLVVSRLWKNWDEQIEIGICENGGKLLRVAWQESRCRMPDSAPEPRFVSFSWQTRPSFALKHPEDAGVTICGRFAATPINQKTTVTILCQLLPLVWIAKLLHDVFPVQAQPPRLAWFRKHHEPKQNRNHRTKHERGQHFSAWYQHGLQGKAYDRTLLAADGFNPKQLAECVSHFAHVLEFVVWPK
jgi:hypothetical protein